MPAKVRSAGSPETPAGLPFGARLCRAEFHLECMETSYRKWHQFTGRGLEDFVDFVAETIGIEVWYTSLPRAGRFSPLLPAIYEKEDIREIDIPEDLNLRFVSRAHNHGILVVSAYKMNLFPALGLARPEWLIRDIPDGRKIEPNHKYFCHNSGFGDWLIRYLEDQLRRFGYDGVWFDDTQYSSRGAWPWPAGCLCPSCADRYLAETGEPLPATVDWGSEAFRRWVNWRYDNLRAFQRRLTGELRSVRPGAIVVFNSYPRAGLHWTTASDLNPAEEEATHFIETDYRRMGPTLTSKIARARGDCEIWGWAPQLAGSLSAVGVAPYLDTDLCSRFSLTAFAHGVHVQGITDYIVPDRVPAVPFEELRRRRALFGGQSIRQCAVHLSRFTRDFLYPTLLDGAPTRIDYGAEPATGPDAYWKQIQGVTEMLEQEHVVYDLLFDRSLTESGLEGYRILVLPSSGCMSDAACDVVRRWVSGGGTLVATYESSLYDELGRRRPSFGLADVLGVDYEGTYDRAGNGGTIYVPLGGLGEKLGAWIGFSGQHTWIRSRPDSGRLEVLATLSTLRQFRPIDAAQGTHDSGHPGMTSNRYGSGLAIYVSGDIGSGFADHPLPRVRSLFGELVRGGGLDMELDAPESLLANVLAPEPGTWNVHLYQRFAPMVPFDQAHRDAQQWAALDAPNRYRDLRIRFPRRRVEAARLAVQNVNLTVEGGGAVLVPLVVQHEVVQVRFER